LNDVPDRTSYLKIPEKDRKETPELSATDPIGRLFVVIDEAQLLFTCGPRLSSKSAQAARAAANVLTQQGRAVGIHVIVATQRPDVKAVDSHTKTNLGGQLCFAMNNAQSSISVIGCGRASEIPKDKKGRAIWKYGSEMLEVQTPYLSHDEMKAIFKEHKKSQPAAEKPPQESNSKVFIAPASSSG
jgi:DNA segregation ATPase FtsK/SpoIIIE-like protein